MDPNAQHDPPALSEGSSSLCTTDWTSPDDQSPISPATSVSPTYHRRSFSRLGPVIEEETAYPGAVIDEASPDLAVDYGLGTKHMKSFPGSRNRFRSWKRPSQHSRFGQSLTITLLACE